MDREIKGVGRSLGRGNGGSGIGGWMGRGDEMVDCIGVWMALID